MMMQRDDPMRARKLLDRRSEPAGLLGGDYSERIGEREMGFGIGIEDGNAETVGLGGRQDHRKLIVPKTAEAARAPHAADIGEFSDPLSMRRQRLRQRAAKLA